MQNLSPKDIARSDIMKLKSHYAKWQCNYLHYTYPTRRSKFLLQVGYLSTASIPHSGFDTKQHHFTASSALTYTFAAISTSVSKHTTELYFHYFVHMCTKPSGSM